VSRTKDPRQFFKLLDRLGIPHPSIAYAPPPDPSEWLMKRVGGSGGGHIAPALLAGAPEPNCYFQRRAPGRAVGVSFLGDGRRAFLLGFSEQWVSRESDSESFRFGGLLQPAVLSRQIGREVPGVLDALVRELGLVGLNSLDLMVDGDDFAVLEVNPRPGANLDIFDGADPAGLFGLHVEACHGRLPQRWTPPAAATAMSVVYAERPLQVPLDVAWPAWVADRPAPGASIAAGAPICTVLAAAATPEYVRRTVASRASDVLSTLLDGATDSSGTALRPRLPARHSDESGHAL
jgi:predicted ATP-grasp superfamily ATP-dependent carboligase